MSTTHPETEFSFDAGGASLGKRISISARAISRHLGSHLRELGIGPGQHMFLLALLEKQGCSQDELAARVFVDKGSAARALRKLEDAGFIRREPVPDNRRMNRIFATDKTSAIEEPMRAILHQTNAALVQGMTPQERETLHRLAQQLESNAKALSEDNGL